MSRKAVNPNNTSWNVLTIMMSFKSFSYRISVDALHLLFRLQHDE